VYARPVALEDALELIAEPDARVLAGGTDVFPAAGETPLRGSFVDITGVRALTGVTQTKNHFRLGGGATWTELARADLPTAFRALKVAAREVGGIQIQNRGTIGGNLCNASPAADGVPPLLVLDAEVELSSLRGVRRLPLCAFIAGNRRTALAPDEILTAIVAPAPPSTARSAFLKLGARRYLVISIVMVAALLDIVEGVVRDARIAIGSCSATARRLPLVESRLIGATADGELGRRLIAEDFADLAPIDDLRATAEYRRDAALTLTRRAIDCCLADEAGGVV
jgi:CO/xanthine dehydrogenase FAD-binding subunit